MPEIRASVDVIRRAAERACEASSLRAVAAQTGMMPMGLRGFIHGPGKPQERTLRKMNLWYAQYAASAPPEGEDDARTAMVILTGLYPRAWRPRAAGRLLDALEAAFRDGGMELPAWIAVLRAELREDG